MAIKNKKYDLATNRLNKWKSIFCDRFYIDVQRTSQADHIYTSEAVSLARKTDTPIVATNSCCFLKREDYEGMKLESVLMMHEFLMIKKDQDYIQMSNI